LAVALYPLTPVPGIVHSLRTGNVMITIQTLGGLSLHGGVRDVGDVSAREFMLALLALLVVAGERGVEPDHARAVLWPDHGSRPDDPLPELIEAIRRDIHPAAILSGNPLRIDPAVVRSDVAEFERALDGRDARTAVALYAGDFLSGFSLAAAPPFESWVAHERGRLERRLRSAQAMLALRSTPTGRTAAIPIVKHVPAAPARPTPNATAAAPAAGTVEGHAPAASPLHPRPITRERGAIIGGRYRVVRELGHGGMATVLLARDTKHERDVAIKFVRADVADAIGFARFQREIALVASLQHPHILPLYDSGETAGSLYYVMPYIEGESLNERLARDRRLPLGEALRTAREVGDALAHAHARGVIHRDVKPANILLTGGHALIGDFGIARGERRTADRRLTDDGYSVGTPAYMSPEQACGDAVDARSDIYSLGCVLYEMIAGRAPFPGSRSSSALAQRFLETPASLREIRAGVPENVEQIVNTTLARIPVDRFPDAAALVRALDEAAAAHVEGPPHIGGWTRFRRWLGAN
jgi:hypothetical protein